MNTNKFIKLSKKRIGTREDVYNGIAQKTSGGMYQADIILKKNNTNGKKYISKKISDRMKRENPHLQYKKKSLKKKNNPNITNYKNNTNNISSNKINRKLSRKNVSFISNNNIVKEYVCSTMNSDSENEEEENFLNINLDELDEIDLTDL